MARRLALSLTVALTTALITSCTAPGEMGISQQSVFDQPGFYPSTDGRDSLEVRPDHKAFVHLHECGQIEGGFQSYEEALVHFEHDNEQSFSVLTFTGLTKRCEKLRRADSMKITGLSPLGFQVVGDAPIKSPPGLPKTIYVVFTYLQEDNFHRRLPIEVASFKFNLQAS